MATGRRPGRPRKVDAPTSPDDTRTDWERWDSRVQHARSLRKEWVETFKVREGEDFYLGRQWSDTDNALVFNHFFATIKTILPNLLFRQPMFYVRAKPNATSPNVERNSQVGEGVLNAVGSQDDHLASASKLAVLQSFFRLGCLKVCYDNTLEPNPQKGDPVWQVGLDGKIVYDPTGNPMQARDPRTGAPMVEPDEVMSDEVYRYRWVDARFLLLPDEGPDQDQWTWMGEEITVPLADAKKDERFPSAKRTQFRSNVSEDEPMLTPSTRRTVGNGPASERFRYIEVYDIREKRVLRWAEGQVFEREFLSDEPIQDGIEDHPYSLLLYNPIQGEKPSPWPIPLVYNWRDVQREYNIKRQQITEGGKRSARKVFITPGMFADEDEAKKALQSPLDMETATVNDLNIIPQMANVPPLSADLYRDVQLLQQDWQIISGSTGARMSNPTSDTATEAMFTERAANLRDADLQGAVAAWLTIAGKKMWQLIKQTLTLEIEAKLRGLDDTQFMKYVQAYTGVDISSAMALPGMKDAFREKYGQESWMRVTRDQLIFEADISIVPGSQRPQTLDAERRSAFEFLQVIGTSPQLAMSKLLLQWIASKFDPPIPAAVVEELNLLAQRMVEVNARQAGRDQGTNGGTQNGGGANNANPVATLAPLLQAVAGAGGV